MLEGQADLTLYDASGLGDARFQRALKEGTLDKLLGDLRVAQRVEGRNMVFSWFSCYSFFHAFNCGIQCQAPYFYNLESNPPVAYLGTILLSTRTEDPTYSEFNNDYTGINSPSYGIGGSCGKRFGYDTIESAYAKSDYGSTGREDIGCRHRFLFLPSEGNSSSIRSLGILYTINRDSTGDSYRASAARLRFKNNVGAPITIVKTSNQVLLVEYTWKLVSV